MHPYRTHTCGELRLDHDGTVVRLSGWVHRKRDHGNLLFVDLRDHYGLTQCVIDVSSTLFPIAEKVRPESVITVTGKVVKRSDDTINPNLPTGEIEVSITEFAVESSAEQLPMQVYGDEPYSDEIRLRYRFLDLRRERMHANILLRSQIITSIRQRMVDQGFVEFQTPILTASSPEGARDFLVPSRLQPGRFYALPQAPQQFKQLIMVSGFDKYFQIAPCFRDEDARADRTPGEFYQLDFEMAYVTQEDVFEAIEPVLHGVFEGIRRRPGGDQAAVPAHSVRRIDAEIRLRQAGPSQSDRDAGRHRTVPRVGLQGLREHDRIERRGAGLCHSGEDRRQPGVLRSHERVGPGTGPARSRLYLLPQRRRRRAGRQEYRSRAGRGHPQRTEPGRRRCGVLRRRRSEDVRLVRRRRAHEGGDRSRPVREGCLQVLLDRRLPDVRAQRRHRADRVQPQSVLDAGQGGLEALETKDPLDILAFQYDIVCNGIELSSGAIRNHRPDIMYKAFGIAGYGPEVVEEKFGGMLRAFQYGAPPHGGSAPGIDRIVMLLADEDNLREIIMFPMNQQAQDLLMGRAERGSARAASRSAHQTEPAEAEEEGRRFRIKNSVRRPSESRPSASASSSRLRSRTIFQPLRRCA